jgi:flagellar hook-basal body complex protein FliE
LQNKFGDSLERHVKQYAKASDAVKAAQSEFDVCRLERENELRQLRQDSHDIGVLINVEKARLASLREFQQAGLDKLKQDYAEAKHRRDRMIADNSAELTDLLARGKRASTALQSQMVCMNNNS